MHSLEAAMDGKTMVRHQVFWCQFLVFNLYFIYLADLNLCNASIQSLQTKMTKTRWFS